jgi:hypothetical protein
LLDGAVVPNGYEMFDVEAPLELLGMKIVESYGPHVHIVRKRTRLDAGHEAAKKVKEKLI